MNTISRRHFLKLVGAAAAAVPSLGWAQTTARFRVRLLVPAYIYPAPGAWNAYINAHNPAKGVEVTLIANPSNGTFSTVDSNYAAAIKGAAAKGLPVLGYIHTQYGQRTLASVEQDVANWLKLYPQITGFFVDEQAATATQLPYYASLFAYIRSKKPGAFIVGNPGRTCDVRYLVDRNVTQANVVVLWENTDQYGSFSGFNVPPAFQTLSPERVAAIIYNCTPLKYITGPTGARAKQIGYIFVTDGSGGNPYGNVPSYWTTGEVPGIQSTNVGF